LKIATWNILATGYIRSEYYPNTPAYVLEPGWRTRELVRHAARLDVDLLCLQEVEDMAFAALRDGLAPSGYAGSYAPRGGNRPDGCALFYRRDSFAPLMERRIPFVEHGCARFRHIVQFFLAEHQGRPLAVLNTHLKWDEPGMPRERQWGYLQIMQVLDILQRESGSPQAQIICGDFNAQPGSAVVETLIGAGMDYAHHGMAGIQTCNSNGEAKLIDYLFYSPALRATPVPTPPIDGSTVLPSPDQPSDHLPLIARFDWV